MSHARDLAGLQIYLTEDEAVKEEFMDSDTVVVSALKSLTASTGTKGFATPGDLPAGAVAGAQAFVNSNNRLYISNGSGWYNIALINNTPYFTTSPDASYTLDKTGIATVVTILGADSDGHDIPQYSAAGDSGFNAIATVTKDSDNGRVFVIKSIDSDGSASKTDGSGTLTFTLSDGKDSVTANSTFSIVFGFNWNGATLSVQEFPNLATASGDRYGTNVTQSGDGEYWATIGKTNGAAELRIFNGRTGSATQQYAGVSPAGSGDFGSSMDMNFDGDALIICSSGSNTHKKAYIYTRSGSTWSLAYTDNGDSLSGTVYPCQGTRLSGTGVNQRAFFRYSSNRVRVLVTTDGWSTSSQEAMIDWGANNSNAIGDIAVSKDGSRLVQSYANATTSLSQIGQLKVWTRSGSTWSLEATLNETSPTIYAGLGQNVSMARDNGDVIIASMNEEGDFNQGGVVIFTRSGTNWSQAQKFSPYTSNPGFQARVGVSPYSGRRGIEISGDGKTMVVVNPKKTVPAAATQGGSFFILSDTGSYNFTISHTVDNAVNDAYRGFGTCASISNNGSTIAIGIVSHDGTYTNGGNVALYTI